MNHNDKVQPGGDVFIQGVYYDPRTQELEVYPMYHPGWWGIPMTPEEAAHVYGKIDRQGVFFWSHVRHIVSR